MRSSSLCLAAVVICQSLTSLTGHAQQADALGRIPILIEPETAEFQQATDRFREHLKSMREIAVRFNTGTSEEERKWKQQWNELAPIGAQLFDDLLQAGAKEYEADPENKDNIRQWLAKRVESEVEHDRLEGLLPVLKTLLQHDQENAELHRQTAIVAFALHDYETARASLSILASRPDAPEELKSTLDIIDQSIVDWEQELKIREQDAQGEPLPRALIKTTRGDIEVELFENQAPNTVANFIYLAETGEYIDQPFATGKQHFIVQGGGDDIVRPPYTIPGEMNRDDARKFFRGTLGLALSGGNDTGYAQFFFVLIPSGELTGRFTAFGRVVRGMDVVSMLTIIDPDAEEEENQDDEDPDQILDIEILSKRDHEYVPEKVQ